MNQSLRAAGGVLATAATVTIVLVAVAMIDPQATALQNGDHDEGAGSGKDASNGDPRSMAHWYRLGDQLDDLETRIDDLAGRREDDAETKRRQLLELESRLRDDMDRGLERVLVDERLLETINSTLAQRGDSQRLDSIETRLKSLTGTVEQATRETTGLRETIGRLQPVLDIDVDPLRPGHFMIKAHRVPLVDVLKRLETLSNREFETTAAAVSMVSIDHLEGVTIEQALEVLLPAAGCAARLEGRKVSVMSLAEARRLRNRAGGSQAAESKTDPLSAFPAAVGEPGAE